VTRRTSRAIFIYVNGRFVRDRTIQHALFEGYSQRLVKGQFPVAVVNINLPFDQVDVNVHPTKNEVRFARQRDVHEAVRRAVAQTLYEKDRPGWEPTRSSMNVGFKQQSRVSEVPMPEFGMRNAESTEFGMRNAEWGKEDQNTRPFDPETRNTQLATRTPQPALWDKKGFSDMRIIGQFHNTYIVCESDVGLILIDQHAAHERVLYEQYSARSSGSRTSAQRLLVPETVELGYREAGVLEKIIPDLRDIGLDIEPFGGNTFVVKAVPVLLAEREVKPVLIEISSRF
jgi:DNA mismatch repair protein MutL